MFLRNFFFKQLEYVPSYFGARRNMGVSTYCSIVEFGWFGIT